MPERDTVPSVYTGTLMEQALLSRQLTFKNKQAETAVITAVDRALSDSIRPVDDMLANQADDIRAKIDLIARQAGEATVELAAFEAALRDGEEIDLEAWARADKTYDLLLQRLTVLIPQSELISERMDDVLAYASELQGKYPSIYRPVLLPNEFA